jgi:hypothetical protein
MWHRARTHRLGRHLLRFRPLSIVFAVLMVLGTATATAEAPTGEVIRDQLRGQDVRLSIPPTPDPKGVAVFFHGQTGGVDNRMDEPWLQALVRSGWIVASSDFHTASWGNEASTLDTQDLVKWATEETGEPVRIFVSGSMGATVSLNAMTHGVEAPACWYGVKPAVDPTKMDAVPGATRIIDDAFDGQPIPADRNPALNIDKFSTETRYRMVASVNDQWVRYDENTGLLADALEDRGADVSILPVTGTHDDPLHFNVSDLVDFAATCG